jgi:hypothetical protein
MQNIIKISTRDQFQITVLCFGFCRTYVAAKGMIRAGSFHVLAHRPPQEASDSLRLSLVCTKSAKSASGTLGAHFVLSKGYSNADLMQKK